MEDTLTPEMTEPATPTRPWNAITHTCGAWWTGLSRSHCPADDCHRTFSCDSAAELHRKGTPGIDRRCVDPATVGLVAKQMPWGVMWQHPGPEPGRDTRRSN
jgi:hypothetical protein